MSQHDMNVANGPGLTFRSDMNGALTALASQSSGATEPSPIFPCQMWADTGTGRLKQRNSANTAWLDKGALDSLGDLSLAGGTMTGPINDAPIQTIASAATTNLAATTSNVVAISGTATITSFGTLASGRRFLRFLGAATLTHNAVSLILPGGMNITTAENDTMEVLSLGGGSWICLRYNLASGKPIAFAYDRSNILGTTTQAGGVATGALFNSGSNANGFYTYMADGTLICTHRQYVSLAIPNLSGSWYYNIASWTFPVAFTSPPKAFVNSWCAGRVISIGRSTEPVSATGTSFFIIASENIPSSTFVHEWMAIGRWF